MNVSAYDAFLAGQSAPSRMLLAELEHLGEKGAGANASALGAGVEGLKGGGGKEKEPIHLRRREGKVRRGGFMQGGVAGVEGDGFVRRGLDGLLGV